MNKYLFIFCFLSIAVYGQAPKKNGVAEKPLFTLGNKAVSTDEFIYLFKKNHQDKNGYTEKEIDEYFELFVKFKLKVAEAESRGMDTVKAFVDELKGYKEELKKPYVAEEDVLARLTKQAYQRMQEEINASHILINIKPDALLQDTLFSFNKIVAIKARVDAGEDFEQLAKELSEDPSAKSNGGDLGYFTALQMVYPFEEAAFSGKVGSVTDPIRTKFGYHLLRIKDRRPSRGQVEVSHILIRGEGDTSKKLIDEIYEKLQDGDDWVELCKQYSQDPGTRDNAGRLKPFGAGALSSAPAFEEAAFSLNEEGSFSPPTQTSFGWHIIRLEKKIPLPTYETLEESLKRRIARDERMQISKTKALIRRKQNLKYEEVSDNKIELLKLSDSTLIKGKWTILQQDYSNDKILFSIGNESYAVSAFLQFVKNKQRTTNLSPTDYLQQLLDQYVDERLAEAEDIKLQEEHPEYRRLVNEYREGILLFSIMEKEVWIKASEDSVGQRRYYESNVEKYKAGARVEAQVFSSENKTFFDLTKRQLIAGDTLQKDVLNKFKSVQNYRAYEKSENSVIDTIDWTVGWHETEIHGIYYLVEVKKIMPPGNRNFEEVRAKVISDYQDSLEQDWINELRKKYPVKVNKKARRLAVSEITAG